MTNIINGKKIAEDLRNNLKNEILKLKNEFGSVPGLAVVQVGNVAASSVYVKAKTKSANEVGIKVFDHHLDDKTSQNDHTTLENKINNDKEVAKDRTASSQLEKVNIVQRLQRRYRQAAMFFEQRMESVDSIIEIANSKGLSREKFLQLIEKKYPMAIA